MTPEEMKKRKDANKADQIRKAKKLLGDMHPNMIKEYQHIFLDSQRGQVVLRDMLGAMKVFSPNLTEEDLAVRNYGVNLMHTIAGAHVTPDKLESLYGLFVSALAEYERNTTPTE